MVEKTYLRTDKSLYAPGDTLWFKGYVFDRQNMIVDESLNFHVFLQSENGLKKADSAWPIVSGMAHGHVVLPLEEGRYFLTAMTPSELNLGTEYSFRKEIFIQSGSIDVIEVQAQLDKAIYRPGEEIAISFHADLSSREVAANERFNYTLLSGDKTVKKGRFKTNENGDFVLGSLPVLAPDPTLRVLISKPATDFVQGVKLSIPIPVAHEKIDLQFFPEGGHLVRGLQSRVAFKALGVDGLPVEVRGTLEDNDGNLIDSIASSYQGMGGFFLRPEKNHYRVRIHEPVGIDSVYQLPKATPTGVVLSVVYADNDTLVKVLSTPEFKGMPLKLTLSQAGRVVYQLPINCQTTSFFKFPWSRFDMGLARLSLKDDRESILAERLLFLKLDDQLNVEITTDQASYLPRDKTEVKIKVTDQQGQPVKGNFTFSAIDDTRAPERKAQPNMMAQILLASELKGRLPTPNYYFSGDAAAPAALDWVLLTHGWRKYTFKTNTDYNSLTGKLVHRKRKKQGLANREISIFNTTTYHETVVETNEQGRFIIPGSHFKYKGDSFIVAARAEGKREKPNLLLDKYPREDMAAYQEQLASIFNQTPSDLSVFEGQNKRIRDRFGDTELLNSVSVTASLSGSGCSTEYDPAATEWRTKQRGELDLGDNNIVSMIKQVSNKVVGFGDARTWSVTGRSLIIYQGTLLSVVRKRWSLNVNGETYRGYSDLDYRVTINCEPLHKSVTLNNIQQLMGGIDFSNVESIAVLDPNIDDSGAPRFRGTVEIHTINDVVIYKPVLCPFVTHTIKPSQVAEFYQSVYETDEAKNDPTPDLRTTIHWVHTVITNEQGEATLSFYNADRDNRIRLTVEGLGMLQRFGFAQKDYRVLMPAVNR